MKKPDLGRFRFRYDPKKGFVRTRERIGKKVARLGERLRSVPLAIIVPLLLVTAVTVMFLTARTDTVANMFTFETADVSIDEPDIDPDDVEWDVDSKPVYLQNPEGETNVPGVVRAMIIPVLKDEDGNILSGDLGNILEAPTGSTLVLGDITLHFDEDWADNWFFKDGYFYYRKVLSPGETTAQLLAGVTLTDGTLSGVSAQGKVTVTIEVLADILEADNEALAEWGVTASDEGVVTPTG